MLFTESLKDAKGEAVHEVQWHHLTSILTAFFHPETLQNFLIAKTFPKLPFLPISIRFIFLLSPFPYPEISILEKTCFLSQDATKILRQYLKARDFS